MSIGIWATRNGTTAFNHLYHYVMLAIFACGLLLLLLPGVRVGIAVARRDGR